jgi:hypothetical protein
MYIAPALAPWSSYGRRSLRVREISASVLHGQCGVRRLAAAFTVASPTTKLQFIAPTAPAPPSASVLHGQCEVRRLAVAFTVANPTTKLQFIAPTAPSQSPRPAFTPTRSGRLCVIFSPPS